MGSAGDLAQKADQEADMEVSTAGAEVLTGIDRLQMTRHRQKGRSVELEELMNGQNKLYTFNWTIVMCSEAVVLN